MEFLYIFFGTSGITHLFFQFFSTCSKDKWQGKQKTRLPSGQEALKRPLCICTIVKIKHFHHVQGNMAEISWANMHHLEFPKRRQYSGSLCPVGLANQNCWDIHNDIYCKTSALPAAPPSALPRVELMISTRPLQSRYSSVPLVRKKKQIHTYWQRSYNIIIIQQ